jgi:hypothetical protein
MILLHLYFSFSLAMSNRRELLLLELPGHDPPPSPLLLLTSDVK